MSNIYFGHTMIRVKDLQKSIDFYTKVLGLKVTKNKEFPDGKFTLVFLAYSDDEQSPAIELTYNWDNTEDYDLGNGFGHTAFESSDIASIVEIARKEGYKIIKEPSPMKFGGSVIAFMEDPDGYKVELIQKGSLEF